MLFKFQMQTEMLGETAIAVAMALQTVLMGVALGVQRGSLTLHPPTKPPLRTAPLDAAGYRPGIADAARFQFDSYTVQDNLVAGSMAGLQMYGNVDIRVLEYSIEGKTFHVPENASAYSIEDDVYRNEWLGFSMRKPDGFTFAKIDAVWPDLTLFSLEGDQAKVTASLLEVVSNDSKLISEFAPGNEPRPAKLAGRGAVMVSTPEKARLVSREGQSVWMITAEGQHANDLLDRVVGAWAWISPK